MTERKWYFKTGVFQSDAEYSDVLHVFCAGYMAAFRVGKPSFTIGYLKETHGSNKSVCKDILTMVVGAK